mgnify:CR=1 FL=1
MKPDYVTVCCDVTLYEAERMSEEDYPYGELRPVLCCKSDGVEMSPMRKVEA